MFKRILVAVDGSPGAGKALQLAAGLQRICDGELIVLTVYRHQGMSDSAMAVGRPDDPENLDDTLREIAKDVAEKAKTTASESGATKVRAFVKMGPPARTIVRFAEEREADLIVLGSRGMGDFDGFLLGSVSHKVTSLADCPVLVA